MSEAQIVLRLIPLECEQKNGPSLGLIFTRKSMGCLNQDGEDERIDRMGAIALLGLNRENAKEIQARRLFYPGNCLISAASKNIREIRDWKISWNSPFFRNFAMQ